MPRLKHQRAVDAVVGERIRVRRVLLGMSQTDLGDKLGMSFQQVQKYERGASRITVSLLVELSSIFDVPVTFFLDGIEANQTKELPNDRVFLTVARYFKETPPSVQGAVVSLLAAMGGKGRVDAELSEVMETFASAPAPSAPVAAEVAAEVAAPAVVPVPEPVARRASPAPTPPPDAPAKSAQVPPVTKQPRRRKWGAVWDPSDISRSKA